MVKQEVAHLHHELAQVLSQSRLGGVEPAYKAHGRARSDSNWWHGLWLEVLPNAPSKISHLTEFFLLHLADVWFRAELVFIVHAIPVQNF